MRFRADKEKTLIHQASLNMEALKLRFVVLGWFLFLNCWKFVQTTDPYIRWKKKELKHTALYRHGSTLAHVCVMDGASFKTLKLNNGVGWCFKRRSQWTALPYLRKTWLAFGIPVYLRHPRAQLLFCWLGNGTAGFWTVGWDGRFAFGVDLSDRDLDSLEGRFGDSATLNVGSLPRGGIVLPSRWIEEKDWLRLIRESSPGWPIDVLIELVMHEK